MADAKGGELSEEELAKLPQWKRNLIIQEKLAKEKEEREKIERAKKIEEIKMRHAGGTPLKNAATAVRLAGITRTTSVGSQQISKAVSNVRARINQTGGDGGKKEESGTVGGSVDDIKATAPVIRATDDIDIKSTSKSTDKSNEDQLEKLKQMEAEIERMKMYKEELENKHTKTVSSFESEMTMQKSKQEEMQEALANLRKMKDELEIQHLSYQKRLEQRVQEEINKKLEVEEELHRTRTRLVAELEAIQNSKETLQQQIDVLRVESEKKAKIEEELENLKRTKERLDSEVTGLKVEAERKMAVEQELERMRRMKEGLEKEMSIVEEERRKKKELEEEFQKVKDNRLLLEKEIEKLKNEKARREEIERELQNIKNSKQQLESQIINLKEETDKRKELEQTLQTLHQSNDHYQKEMDLILQNATHMGSEREAKLEQLLNSAKDNSNLLQNEIENLRKESEKKRQVEAELDKVKNACANLTSEVETLHREAEKQRSLREELEKVQAAKEKLMSEMEAFQKEHERRLQLEAELEELKEIKNRFASEVDSLKSQQQQLNNEKQEHTEIPPEVVKETQKTKEENEILSITVKKQKEKISKLKEKNRRLSKNKKALPLLKMSPQKSPQDDLHQRIRPKRFKSACVLGADTNPVAMELIQTLRAVDIRVVAFVRPNHNVHDLHLLGATTARGAIDNLDDLMSAMTDCDVVFHCAFQTTGDTYQHFSVNVNGATTTVQAAKLAKCKKLVVLSTAEVVVGNIPLDVTYAIDESIKLSIERTESLFAKSMLMAEHAILKATKPKSETAQQPPETPEKDSEGEYTLQVAVIRPSWVWGKMDAKLNKILEAVKTGKFTWVNGGTYLYSTCYISNVVEGLLLAAEYARRGIYYVSDPYPISFKEFITKVAATQNVDCSRVPSMSTWYGSAVSWFQKTTGASPYAEISLDAVLTRTFVISDKKARSKLGYKSLVSFEKALDIIRDQFISNLKTPRTESLQQRGWVVM